MTLRIDTAQLETNATAIIAELRAAKLDDALVREVMQLTKWAGEMLDGAIKRIEMLEGPIVKDLLDRIAEMEIMIQSRDKAIDWADAEFKKIADGQDQLKALQKSILDTARLAIYADASRANGITDKMNEGLKILDEVKA